MLKAFIIFQDAWGSKRHREQGFRVGEGDVKRQALPLPSLHYSADKREEEGWEKEPSSCPTQAPSLLRRAFSPTFNPPSIPPSTHESSRHPRPSWFIED